MVADRDALPPNTLRALMETMEMRGLLTLPLMNGDDCLGFVGLDAVHQPRVYGGEEITLLELFAQMLVNLRLRALAAAQVRDMTERLEQKVRERTQQLNESVQSLQTVNRELESFTYSASHDLRTPLRGIEGFSTLLLDEHAAQLDEQGRDYLQRIQRATRHMSQLVNDLLAYSRLQQMVERIEPVPLSVFVQTVAAPFDDELEARQGQLSVQMPDDLQVRADPKGLAIVLRNLIDNALKFTPASAAPRIRIEAQPLGDRVRLSVSDQGIGFDMKHHDRIFGMFQRLHRQDQIPGTGIGLALVHKAVERMGGHIRAEATPGQGARFEVDLPRA
jgi:signal transduction histidine kinase